MKTIKDLSPLIYLFLFMVISVFLMSYCENKKDPYEPGMHMNYNIECENGYSYKVLGRNRGVIQILNSDGTPLRCGQKIY
jgi:hypothetical protein